MPSKRRKDSRGGRKAVRNACVNCRKAKAACDDSLPCRRCVRLGHEDTCVPAVHRKLGRPRKNQNKEGSSTSSSDGNSRHKRERPSVGSSYDHDGGLGALSPYNVDDLALDFGNNGVNSNLDALFMNGGFGGDADGTGGQGRMGGAQGEQGSMRMLQLQQQVQAQLQQSLIQAKLAQMQLQMQLQEQQRSSSSGRPKSSGESSSGSESGSQGKTMTEFPGFLLPIGSLSGNHSASWKVVHSGDSVIVSQGLHSQKDVLKGQVDIDQAPEVICDFLNGDEGQWQPFAGMFDELTSVAELNAREDSARSKWYYGVQHARGENMLGRDFYIRTTWARLGEGHGTLSSVAERINVEAEGSIVFLARSIKGSPEKDYFGERDDDTNGSSAKRMKLEEETEQKERGSFHMDVVLSALVTEEDQGFGGADRTLVSFAVAIDERSRPENMLDSCLEWCTNMQGITMTASNDDSSD